MNSPQDTHNQEQSQLWNGPAGRAWVDSQNLLDHMFKPIEELLVQAVAAKSRRNILDIGCGFGSTTLAVARALAPTGGGHCTGIDISEAMIAAARTRAEQQSASAAASFVVADAQTHTFQPNTFDMLISRFGVMFFADPVRAFQNLRSAATSNADLQFYAWRSAKENPFMTTAESAAAPLLPNLPARKTEGPGQFAFADPDRIKRILEQSGWSDICLEPADVPCTFPEPSLVPYMSRLGPVGLALQEQDDTTRSNVIAKVRAAFQPFVHGSTVRFTAACWLASAKAAK